MSDEEMNYMTDEDYAFDDEEDLEEIRRQADAARTERQNRESQARQAAAASRRQPQNVPPALAGMMAGQGGIFGGFGNMMAAAAQGFAPGNPFGMHTSAAAFRQNYTAYSTSIHEASEGRMERIRGGRQNLMFGGNILMPPEALDLLTRLEIEGPWTFELINSKNHQRRTHCGVLEFTAPTNTIYLPQWMMTQLGFEEGAPVRVNGAALPKGRFVKLQPQEVTFLELSDPKAVLERALPNFTCLTKGDIIEISHQHINLSFLIMEVQPDADGINILNTDIEVDFAPPVGYVEPERKPMAPTSTMATKLGINVGQTEDAEASTSVGYTAFVGTGQSLGGKRIKGKGTKLRKIDPVEDESRIQRTDRQKVVNANDMTDNQPVPAALELPFGHLFFGYTLVPITNGATSNLASMEGVSPEPAFHGQGATLSGRRRPGPDIDPSSTALPTLAKPNNASIFAGKGHSLQPREVIEID